MDTVPIDRATWSKNRGRRQGKALRPRQQRHESWNGHLPSSRAIAARQNSEGSWCNVGDGSQRRNRYQGAASLLRHQIEMHRAGATIIGEMTSYAPLIVNKDAPWMRLSERGMSAHGPMPDKGITALYKLAKCFGGSSNTVSRMKSTKYSVLTRSAVTL
jgi:hypothetical protein